QPLGAGPERFGRPGLGQVAPVVDQRPLAVAAAVVGLTDLEEEDRVLGDLVRGRVLAGGRGVIAPGGGGLAGLVVLLGCLVVRRALARRALVRSVLGPRGSACDQRGERGAERRGEPGDEHGGQSTRSPWPSQGRAPGERVEFRPFDSGSARLASAIVPLPWPRSTGSATSASSRTSMPARRPCPSGSSSTPASGTRSGRCTTGRPRWTGASRSASAASPSRRRRPASSGRSTRFTSSTPRATS